MKIFSTNNKEAKRHDALALLRFASDKHLEKVKKGRVFPKGRNKIEERLRRDNIYLQ